MKNLINKETKQLNIIRIGDSTKVFHTFDNGDQIFCDQKYINVNTSYNTTLSKGYLRVGCQSISIDKVKDVLNTLNLEEGKEIKTEPVYFYKDKRMKNKPVEESTNFFIFRGYDGAYRAYAKRYTKIKQLSVISELISVKDEHVKYNPSNAILINKSSLINNLTNILELYKLIYEKE